ncbi:hypothetical protein [Streptomyces sp. NPDC059460]|uniref:hypothetical protein n=1 Tax=Streptomyces sp. NPDC059460 TaxID=3346840 RepID=UPI0036ABC6BB
MGDQHPLPRFVEDDSDLEGPQRDRAGGAIALQFRGFVSPYLIEIGHRACTALAARRDGDSPEETKPGDNVT